MEAALARGDLPKLKKLLERVDKESESEKPGDLSLDYTYQIAWIRAASGDTAAAMRQLDRVLNALPSISRLSLHEAASAAAVVRAMALRADLAESQKDYRTATRWARAVMDLWQNADSELSATTNEMKQILRKDHR